MTSQNPLLHLATISLLVGTAIVSSCSFPTIVQAVPALNAQTQREGFNPPRFRPPLLGAPRTTVGAGTRSGGGACINGAMPLTALIPKDNLSLTTTQNPTFFIYIPQTQAKSVRVVLKDEEENEIARQTLPIPSTDSIVSFKLAKISPTLTLKLNKNYHWYFTLMCPSEDRSDDVQVDGWLQRTTLRADIMKALKKVAPPERAGLYAANGIWNEAVTTLAELRLTQPKNPKITTYWRELLKSVDLDNIAEKPIVQ